MKIIAIFIALNAQESLKAFYRNFPTHLVDQIILVDDDSDDNTFQIAKDLGIVSYKNKTRLGYGGNMKRALTLALRNGADIIIDLHPDGEYKPNAIPQALKEIKQGKQFILGNRFYKLNRPLKSGMRVWKFFPLVLLNYIHKLILQAPIDDFHQGFRVYTRKMLEQIDYQNNSNDYLFSFEIIVQAIRKKIPMAQVPVQTSYRGKKRGASIKNSIKYFIGTFGVLNKNIWRLSSNDK